MYTWAQRFTVVSATLNSKENDMSAKVEIKGSVARIILSGALDFSTQGDMRKANEEALAIDIVKEINIDLADVTFVDSSVIRALLLLQQKTITSGKILVLVNIRDSIREVFDIGGFDKIFTIR